MLKTKIKFIKIFFIFSSLVLNQNILSEGFLKGTLVKIKDNYIPIEQLKENDFVLSYDFKNFEFTENQIIKIEKKQFDKVIKITINNNEFFLVSPNQKFYCPLSKENWIEAKYLRQNQFILKNIKKLVRITDIKEENLKAEFYTLSFKNNHNFFITTGDFFVHNSEIATTLTYGVAVVGGGALGIFVETVAAPVIFGGALAFIAYDVFFKDKSINRHNSYNNDSDSNHFNNDDYNRQFNSPNKSNQNKPNNNGNNDKAKQTAAAGLSAAIANKFKKLIYEKAPYHGKKGKGWKSKAPNNGQLALDKSIEINKRARVSTQGDPDFTVLREHESGKFHGYSVKWDQLNEKMQQALIDSGLVNWKGKKLK